MRRSGVFSLVAYILYTLFWVAMTVLLHFGILTQDDAWQLGTALLFVGLFEIYTIGLAIGNLLLVILKLLHINKGWFACGIICLIFDLRMACVSALSVISSGVYVQVMPGVILVLLVPLVLSVGSLIANIRSLKD